MFLYCTRSAKACLVSSGSVVADKQSAMTTHPPPSFLVVLPLICSWQLHLPYFNLADGARSTDASLLVEVVVLKYASENEHSVTRPDDDDEYSAHSSSSDARQMTDVCQRGHREAVSRLGASSKILASVRIDVQTALSGAFGRSGAISTATSTENSVVFKVAKTKGAGGTNYSPYPEYPTSIPVSVKLSFSKAFSNAAAVVEQRMESTKQRTGRKHDVPVFFVVATTLFDCASTMKEAELRAYIRYGDTEAVSLLSSAGRGEIGKHSLVVAQ